MLCSLSSVEALEALAAAHLDEAELELGNTAAARSSADEAVARLCRHELRWRETRALPARAGALLATEGANAAEPSTARRNAGQGRRRFSRFCLPTHEASSTKR
jgi:hypothetical protein